MRVLLVAAAITLLPVGAFAQTDMRASDLAQVKTTAPATSSSLTTLVVTAGVITAVIAADIFTSGALSGPLLRVLGLEAAPAVGTAIAVVPEVVPVAATAAAVVPAVVPEVVPVAAAAIDPAVVASRPWWRFW
ncbi:MAG: hypothetical protein WCK65_03230 [Rhodospirillaceae bacterium]